MKKQIRFQRYLLKRAKPFRYKFNNIIARYSLISNDPVFNAELFDYLEPLKQSWREIRAEYEKVQTSESIPSLGSVSKDHKRLDNQGKWLSYFLWGYGVKFRANCEKCPVTAELIENIPGLLSAIFSIHQPGAHLPRHTGVTKGMITYHLGLKIPNACFIDVEDQKYTWKEGQFFVFDDTYHHEVFNQSEQDRVILLLHVKRPLKQPGKFIQNIFFWMIRHSPFVTETKQALGV